MTPGQTIVDHINGKTWLVVEVTIENLMLWGAALPALRTQVVDITSPTPTVATHEFWQSGLYANEAGGGLMAPWPCPI